MKLYTSQALTEITYIWEKILEVKQTDFKSVCITSLHFTSLRYEST
jgi:hypothetical protein